MINENEQKQAIFLPIMILMIGLLLVGQMFYRSPRSKEAGLKADIVKLKKTAKERQSVKIDANPSTTALAEATLRGKDTQSILLAAGIPASALAPAAGNSYKIDMDGSISVLAEILAKIGGSVAVTAPSGQMVGEAPLLQISQISLEESETTARLRFQATRIR